MAPTQDARQVQSPRPRTDTAATTTEYGRDDCTAQSGLTRFWQLLQDGQCERTVRGARRVDTNAGAVPHREETSGEASESTHLHCSTALTRSGVSLRPIDCSLVAPCNGATLQESRIREIRPYGLMRGRRLDPSLLLLYWVVLGQNMVSCRSRHDIVVTGEIPPLFGGTGYSRKADSEKIRLLLWI